MAVSAVTPAWLEDAYAALAAEVVRVDDSACWADTGCVGWAVRDLVHHLRADCLRALVAVHTPAGRAADCDEVAYWSDWGSDPETDELTRRCTRVEAGTRPWSALRTAYVEAAAAAARAVAGVDPDAVVLTQGHALRVDHLASTLLVEATLHHLDLVTALPEATGPTADGLAETRRVCEALLGRTLPGWSDRRVALVSTGRTEPAPAERADLTGAGLPVFT